MCQGAATTSAQTDGSWSQRRRTKRSRIVRRRYLSSSTGTPRCSVLLASKASRQKSPPIPLHTIGAIRGLPETRFHLGVRDPPCRPLRRTNRITQRGNGMSKTTFVIAVLAGLVAGGAYVLPVEAQVAPPDILAEPLTARSVFVDDISLKFRIKLDGDATHVVDVKDPSLTV